MTREQINDAIREDMKAYTDSPNAKLRRLASGIKYCAHTGEEPYKILAHEYRYFKSGTEEKEVAYKFMRKYDVPKVKIEARKEEQEENERRKAVFDRETDELRRKSQYENIGYLFVWILSFFLSLGLVTLKGATKSSRISTRKFGNGRFQ